MLAMESQSHEIKSNENQHRSSEKTNKYTLFLLKSVKTKYSIVKEARQLTPLLSIMENSGLIKLCYTTVLSATITVICNIFYSIMCRAKQ
jgi:hypothetical protein